MQGRFIDSRRHCTSIAPDLPGPMSRNPFATSSHAMLGVLAERGVDRAFLVPGESYLGLLDALNDFPSIQAVTCRHEAGAGFMACADARLTGRPALVMVSRGPGASHAAIAVHAAQQDAVPMILVVGQVPCASLRRGAFQEIDYGKMFDGIAKAVFEPTDPHQLPEMAQQAWLTATSPTPGPVVLAVPEDVQHAPADPPMRAEAQAYAASAAPVDVQRIRMLLDRSERPLIVAGGEFDVPDGRAALLRFAQSWQMPVLVSFRRHDLFPSTNPLYAGDLGLANAAIQMELLQSADLILALGTRLGDITTQGYTFPAHPHPRQAVVHVHRDPCVVARHLAVTVPLSSDPVALCRSLSDASDGVSMRARSRWSDEVRRMHLRERAWPSFEHLGAHDPIDFTQVARALDLAIPDDAIVCLDAGNFAAPIYRHFSFVFPRRLIAPISGAMGYGTPAAIACQLRYPHRRVVCVVGDGGFMMSGWEMHAASQRRLPIVFIVANNSCFGSIRRHQRRRFPGRPEIGTTVPSPDLAAVARAFGIDAQVIDRAGQVQPAIERALSIGQPSLVEVITPAPD